MRVGCNKKAICNIQYPGTVQYSTVEHCFKWDLYTLQAGTVNSVRDSSGIRAIYPPIGEQDFVNLRNCETPLWGESAIRAVSKPSLLSNICPLNIQSLKSAILYRTPFFLHQYGTVQYNTVLWLFLLPNTVLLYAFIVQNPIVYYSHSRFRVTVSKLTTKSVTRNLCSLSFMFSTTTMTLCTCMIQPASSWILSKCT